MRAVLSLDAVTMRDPSGLNVAEFTASLWPRRTAISLLLPASQMRAVVSHDAVTMRDPSGLTVAEDTASLCPPRPRCHLVCPSVTANAAAAGDALTAPGGNLRSMRVPCDANLSALSKPPPSSFTAD